MFDVRSVLELTDLDIAVDGFAARTEQRYVGCRSVETFVK